MVHATLPQPMTYSRVNGADYNKRSPKTNGFVAAITDNPSGSLKSSPIKEPTPFCKREDAKPQYFRRTFWRADFFSIGKTHHPVAVYLPCIPPAVSLSLGSFASFQTQEVCRQINSSPAHLAANLKHFYYPVDAPRAFWLHWLMTPVAGHRSAASDTKTNTHPLPESSWPSITVNSGPLGALKWNSIASLLHCYIKYKLHTLRWIWGHPLPFYAFWSPNSSSDEGLIKGRSEIGHFHALVVK